MTDGIIKGTGNSRYIKTVANALALYPTYESFMEAFISGEIPIDLFGINPSGWNVQGDKLGKSTLLTDALCTSLGLATTATPTQAMEKLRQNINTVQSSAIKMGISGYAGTGGYNAANPSTISFSFAPKFIIALGWENGNVWESAISNINDTYGNSCCVYMPGVGTSATPGGGFRTSNRISVTGLKSNGGKTLTWYVGGNGASAYVQLNNTGCNYYFAAFA